MGLINFNKLQQQQQKKKILTFGCKQVIDSKLKKEKIYSKKKKGQAYGVENTCYLLMTHLD